jgi:hypothetical protein
LNDSVFLILPFTYHDSENRVAEVHTKWTFCVLSVAGALGWFGRLGRPYLTLHYCVVLVLYHHELHAPSRVAWNDDIFVFYAMQLQNPRT